MESEPSCVITIISQGKGDSALARIINHIAYLFVHSFDQAEVIVEENFVNVKSYLNIDDLKVETHVDGHMKSIKSEGNKVFDVPVAQAFLDLSRAAMVIRREYSSPSP
jgi:hypothetical protein